MNHSVFDCENNFYLNCDNRRLSKLIIHYELLKLSLRAKGDIVECGVFKGASFVNLASMRNILGIKHKRLIGFDIFGTYPFPKYAEDLEMYNSFIEQAGDQSISRTNLSAILERKGIDNFELVEGDITRTVPDICNSIEKISFLNLDTDLYHPAKTILQYLYPKMSVGAVLLLDDYNIFPGETLAVNEYFTSDVEIKKFDFRDSPSYIIKK